MAGTTLHIFVFLKKKHPSRNLKTKLWQEKPQQLLQTSAKQEHNATE